MIVTPPVMPEPPSVSSSANSCRAFGGSNGCQNLSTSSTNGSPSVPIMDGSVDELRRPEPSTSFQLAKSCPHSGSEPIRTFVFLDLETSGLFSARNRITEFAMLAVSRGDLAAMKAVPATKNTVCDGNAQVSNESIQKDVINQEVAKNRAKRRLFSDELDEESVVGTYHPHFVDKRLKSLKINPSELYLNDSRARNAGSCSPEQEAQNVSIDEQSSGPETSGHDTNDNYHTSGPEQLHNSSIQHNSEPSPTKQTNDLAVQTFKRSTSHVHALPRLPRIIEKLSKVFNPRSLIFPATEEISGLNNIVLENCATMDANFCNLFLNFLDFLPKPICLVGHNAVQFDFPIMLAEFYSATDCQFKCPDVFCADSLTILKVLDKIEVHDEINKAKDDVAKNLDWFLSDDIFESSSANEQPQGEQDSSMSVINENLNSNGSKITTEAESSTNLAFSSAESTPNKRPNVYGETSNAPGTPVTPSLRVQPEGNGIPDQPKKAPSSPPCTPESNSMFSASHSRSFCPPTPTKCPPRKRKPEPNILIFPPKSSFKSKVLLACGDKEYNVGFRPSQKAFSQPVIYQRLFGKSYDAHRAEKDCEALLRIAGHYGAEFASAADVLKVAMSTIKPAWITSKMKLSDQFKQAWQ